MEQHLFWTVATFAAAAVLCVAGYMAALAGVSLFRWLRWRSGMTYKFKRWPSRLHSGTPGKRWHVSRLLHGPAGPPGPDGDGLTITIDEPADHQGERSSARSAMTDDEYVDLDADDADDQLEKHYHLHGTVQAAAGPLVKIASISGGSAPHLCKDLMRRAVQQAKAQQRKRNRSNAKRKNTQNSPPAAKQKPKEVDLIGDSKRRQNMAIFAKKLTRGGVTMKDITDALVSLDADKLGACMLVCLLAHVVLTVVLV